MFIETFTISNRYYTSFMWLQKLNLKPFLYGYVLFRAVSAILVTLRHLKQKQKLTIHYLRAESMSTTVDDTLKRFVSTMRQYVSFEPSPRTRSFTLNLASIPMTHKVVVTRLRIYVSRL